MRKRLEGGSDLIYLVRSYDQALVPHDSTGYYFSREETEEVKRQLEEQYPHYLFSIEEFERNPPPCRKITKNRNARK